jgi:hypothetical protein
MGRCGRGALQIHCSTLSAIDEELESVSACSLITRLNNSRALARCGLSNPGPVIVSGNDETVRSLSIPNLADQHPEHFLI